MSYYEKGFWTGMALDLELRMANGGRRGLPEMFRRLWERFGRRGQAIDESDVREAATAVAGRSMDRFFERYVHGTSELHLPALLTAAGLDFAARAEWDEGGPSGQRARPRAQPPSPRLDRHRPSTRPDDHSQRGARVACVASRAHLRRRDCGPGRRARHPLHLRQTGGDCPPGERIRVAYFRRDQLEEATLTLALNPDMAVVDLRPPPSRAKRPPPCGRAGSACAWAAKQDAIEFFVASLTLDASRHVGMRGTTRMTTEGPPWRNADEAMSRYAQGDDTAFGAVYDAVAPRLEAYLRRHLGEPALVEDIIQHTFLQMHDKRGHFSPARRSFLGRFPSRATS